MGENCQIGVAEEARTAGSALVRNKTIFGLTLINLRGRGSWYSVPTG